MPTPSRRLCVVFPPAPFDGIVKHRDAMGMATSEEAVRDLVNQALSADPHSAVKVTGHYEALAQARGPILRKIIIFFRELTQEIEETEGGRR